MNTVEELIKLGQQLEKDHEHQLQYVKSMGRKQSPDVSQKFPANKPTDNPLVKCWRCKRHHSPGHCPQYASSFSNQPGKPHQTSNQQGSPPFCKPGGGRATNNSVTATTTNQTTPHKRLKNSPSKQPPLSNVVIPQQLIIPVGIGSWSGKAIVDTGASYTMINENLGKKFYLPGELQPWTLGPLYLANGEAEVPLGWIQLQISLHISLHSKTFTLPVAVLSPQALTYPVVLGLDFIFFTGLQINVYDKKYSFKSSAQKEFPFQPGHASIPDHISPKPMQSAKP